MGGAESASDARTESERDDAAAGEAAVEPTSPRTRAVLRHVRGRVLDVGCVNHNAKSEQTTNWLHKHLRDRTGSVVGIDYLADEVARLRERGYDVRVADAQAFDLGEEFDTVVAGELIEHLPNPGSFLSCVRDHLTADGRLVLTTPNVWCGISVAQTLTPGEVKCNSNHVCYFDERTLRQLLEREGFAVESMELLPPPPDWSSSRVDRVAFEVLALAYRAGLKRLGSPTLLAVARPTDDGDDGNGDGA